MLKLPAFKQEPDAAVFQDDEEFWRFYIIPGFPSVRVDDKGNPVFLLIKYAFSDEARGADPSLPKGGGYLAFDAELRLPAGRFETIRSELQKYVDEEYARRVALSMVSTRKTYGTNVRTEDPTRGGVMIHNYNTSITLDGQALPPVPSEKPSVVIGEPLWKGGKVRLMAPESAALVQKKVGEQPASLLGSNIAAFSMDLTADGATFMEKTLVDADGRGGTDLTPIAIAYDLTFAARIPPAKAFVQIKMSSLYHAMKELDHKYDGHGCDDDEYSTIEQQYTTAVQAGYITVQIDAGGSTDPEIIKVLQSQAQAFVTKTIEEALYKKEPAPPAEESGWGDEAATESADIYRLKSVTESTLLDVAQTMEIEPTIEYTLHPQGTLETFLSSGGKDTKKFVRVVDLDDNFFKTLGLSVRAFAQWEADAVDFVEVEVLYEGIDEARQRVTKTQTFTFTPASRDVLTWDPSLIGKERKYKYRTRVGFRGGKTSELSRWTDATTRSLNITVTTPGKIDVELAAAGMDFANTVTAALVTVRYEDAGAGVRPEEVTFVLTQEKPSATYQRVVYAEVTRPLEYKVQYILKNEAEVVKDWQQTTSKKLVITDPFTDVLNVSFVPGGSWEDVQQAIVSAEYKDPGNTFVVDQQFELKEPGEFKQWKVVLRDPRIRDFRYKILATYKSGAEPFETDWARLTGDQPVAVRVRTPPRLDVSVVGTALDFTQTPLVKVSLRYDDASGNVHHATSVTLTAAQQAAKWSVGIADGTKRAYRYVTTYYPTNGPPVERAEEVGEDPQLVVLRYSSPRVGAEVSPTFVNFAETPLVEVELRYDDPGRNIQESTTLSFTENKPQPWFVYVADDAPREYSATVTYYVGAEGAPSSLPVARFTKNKLVIPRYVKPA